MSSDRDSEWLQRRLADEVTEKLAEELPRVSAHPGEEYASATDDPMARSLRKRGGSFQWVAFGFDPHSMWDAHVGVLIDTEVIVGCHVHERVSADRPEELEALVNEVDADYRYSEIATEHQFNRPPVPVEAVDPDELAGEVADLCRRFEPIVDEMLES